MVSHHLAHLKMVESDKHAIKEFDRRLPFELEVYSMAAAVESTIPARYYFSKIYSPNLHVLFYFCT